MYNKLIYSHSPDKELNESVVGDGLTSPFLLLVNQVLILCSVIPSESPDAP